jgi:23S rRNA (cytidine1920-2'-O)/16S rRNA (cytidine1409-2'-O)-methyltransferase
MRQRLDLLLVERGLAETRSRAQALVMAGRVRVEGQVVDKAGAQVDSGASLEVEQPPRYVSRGGDKLQTALDRWSIDVRGELCLDVGASTGGFTDCLLQHGAERVIAVDVGRNQLHERLRSDPRVVVMEQVNARALEPDQLPFVPAFLVVDVSFISLKLVLPPAVGCLDGQWRGVVLVKPQFEAGRGRAPGGVVRDQEVRRAVLQSCCEFARNLPSAILGVCDSSVPGPAGNREYLLYLASPGHPSNSEHEVDVNAEIAAAISAAGDPGERRPARAT